MYTSENTDTIRIGSSLTHAQSHNKHSRRNTHTHNSPPLPLPPQVQQPVELGGCGLHPGTVQQLQEPSVLDRKSGA